MSDIYIDTNDSKKLVKLKYNNNYNKSYENNCASTINNLNNINILNNNFNFNENKIQKINKLPNINFNKKTKNSSNILLSVNNIKQQGYGLWCVSTDNNVNNKINNKSNDNNNYFKNIVSKNKLLNNANYVKNKEITNNNHNKNKNIYLKNAEEKYSINNKSTYELTYDSEIKERNNTIEKYADDYQGLDEFLNKHNINKEKSFNKRYANINRDYKLDDSIDNMDKKVIKMLKKRVESINIQLQESLIKQNELEVETNKAIEEKNDYKKIFEFKNLEINKLKTVIISKDEDILKYKQNIDDKNTINNNLYKEIEKLNDIINKGKAKILELEEQFNVKTKLLNDENQSLFSRLQKLSTLIDDESDTNINTSCNNAISKIVSKNDNNNNNTSNLCKNTNNNSTNINSNDKIIINENSNNNLSKLKVKEDSINKNLILPPPNKLQSEEFKLSLKIVDLQDKIEKLEEQNNNLKELLKRKKEDNEAINNQLISCYNTIENIKGDIKWKESNIIQKKIENKLLKSKLCNLTKVNINST